MGGFGSGRPARQGREMVENCLVLDVNRLHRNGCLKPGWAGTSRWTQDGEQIARIDLRAEEGRVHLSYRYQVDGGEWQDVEETVRLLWRPGTVNLLAVRRRALWADGQTERHHAAMLVLLTSAQIRNAPVLAARYWAAVT